MKGGKRKKMKKEIIFSMLMVLVVVSVMGVVSAETLVSDVGVEYEVEVLDAFKNQTWIRGSLRRF